MRDLLVRQCWHITTKERFRGWTIKMGNSKKRQDNSKINTLIRKRSNLHTYPVRADDINCRMWQTTEFYK